jgi:hypothetical protein
MHLLPALSLLTWQVKLAGRGFRVMGCQSPVWWGAGINWLVLGPHLDCGWDYLGVQGVHLGGRFLTWRRQEASLKVEGHLGGEGLLPGGAEPHLRRGDLTCIAQPYLRPRGSRGAQGWGAGAGGRGQSSLAGRGRGATRNADGLAHLAWVRGGRVRGVAWPGSGGRSWWAPSPPARVRSRLDLFTPRPAAAAAAAGGGGGRPPVLAAAVANRRAACK